VQQIASIAASIVQFGFTNPLLVDENHVLIAGHGRLAAAQQLGRTELPVIVLAGLSDTQKQALRIADNKLALTAGWDDDLLRAELMDLRDVGFDLALTGFGEMEVAQLFAPDTDPLAEWDGMPEFEQADESAHQTIAVHFKDQAAVEAFAALIGQPLTNKTRFVWFPRVARRVPDDAYAAAVPDLHTV
jgi:ParB-like chromosome segregation protein Spo0J